VVFWLPGRDPMPAALAGAPGVARNAGFGHFAYNDPHRSATPVSHTAFSLWLKG
jgi:hypothetical protein